MCKDISGIVDALDRASFDVELFVAEAFLPATISASNRHPVVISTLPLLHREVPVRDGTVPNVLPQQDVDTSSHMSKHGVTNDDHFIESTQYLTNLLRGEPTHVAASRHVGCIDTNSSSRRHCGQHRSSISAQRTKWGVEIE